MADQNQYGFFRDVLLNDGALVVSGITGGGDAENGIASGGTTGQILAKVDDTNYNTEWVNVYGIPTGGTSGQTLSKIDNTNYNIGWTTPSGLPSFLEYNETDKTFWNNGNGMPNTNSSNVCFGEFTLRSTTFGNDLVAIGYEALRNNTLGNNSVAVGSGALRSQVGSVNVITSNTAIGKSALINLTSGAECTAVGSAAGINNTTGVGNTFIGYLAGLNNTTGSNNTTLGYQTTTGNRSNCILLGREATATANNQFVVGSDGYNAGTVVTEAAAQTRTWNVIINGVSRKILLA